MTEPRLVTAQEMVEFVMSQADERLIDYSECSAEDSCGCLMVQFGKSLKLDFTGVGYFGWVNSVGETHNQLMRLEEGYAYDDFGKRCIGRAVTTYGETKAYCRAIFPKFCGVDSPTN